jgi:beta-glucanase (GH16 family)
LDAADVPPGYRLVWSDEFNYQGAPHTAKWDYEEGFVRNKELQCYTRDRRQNARVEGGMLVIEGRKERFKNPQFVATHAPHHRSDRAGEYADYTAASLTTLHTASWLYGRIEVRAKLPHGKGVWPTIWMLGAGLPEVGWPACGEIDILEFVGHMPNRVHATVHYPLNGKHQSSHKELVVEKPGDAFHVYAVLPQQFLIDYVRVYQRTPDAAEQPGSRL